MFLLFINGHPTLYQLHPDGEHYLFVPDPELADGEAFTFGARRVDGQWHFEGVLDPDIIHQAEEELRLYIRRDDS